MFDVCRFYHECGKERGRPTTDPRKIVKNIAFTMFTVRDLKLRQHRPQIAKDFSGSASSNGASAQQPPQAHTGAAMCSGTRTQAHAALPILEIGNPIAHAI